MAWNSNLRLPVKDVLLIGLLFLPAWGLRMQFASLFPGPKHTPDSSSYLDLGMKIYQGQGPCNAFRTPLYPLFLAANAWMFGEENLHAVVASQYLLSALSIAFIYLIVRQVTAQRPAAFAAGLFTALNTNVVRYEQTIMTEGIAMFVFLGIVLVATLVIWQKPRLNNTMLLALTSLGAIYFRPVFLYLAIVGELLVIALAIMNKLSGRKVLLHGATYGMVVAFPILCTLLVNHYILGTDIGEFSTVLRKNIYGKVLQYNLQDNIPDPSGLFRTVAVQLRNRGEMSPTVHLQAMTSKLFGEEEFAWREMGRLSRMTVRRHLSEFLIETVRLMPAVYQEERAYFGRKSAGAPDLAWTLAGRLDDLLFARTYPYLFWIIAALLAIDLLLARVARSARFFLWSFFMLLNYLGYLFTIAATGYAHYARFLFFLEALGPLVVCITIGFGLKLLRRRRLLPWIMHIPWIMH